MIILPRAWSLCISRGMDNLDHSSVVKVILSCITGLIYPLRADIDMHIIILLVTKERISILKLQGFV